MASEPAYAGDLPSTEVWKALQEDKTAVLVDVRTRAEWTFVGIPDLSGIGNTPVLIEWQSYPAMDVDPGFVDNVRAALAERNAGPDTPVYFLCRSGARSRSAATVLTQAGYTACFNISDGFEGPCDDLSHRGQVSGWKAAGLPWVQS